MMYKTLRKDFVSTFVTINIYCCAVFFAISWSKFPRHFLSPNFGCLGGNWSFSTPTPVNVNYPDWACPRIVTSTIALRNMTEFRVRSQSNETRDPRRRLLGWGAAILVFGLVLLFASAPSDTHPFNPVLGWSAVSILVGVNIVVLVLGLRMGRERVKRSLVFLLTDSGLTQKRIGWPDERVAFSEIEALRQQRDRLVIESVEPRRKISVPTDLENFESLRAELAKHAGFKESSRLGSVGGFFVAIVSLISWWLVLESQDAAIVRGAGVLTLLLLMWSAVYAYRGLRITSKKPWIGVLFSVIWLAAFALALFRITFLR